MHSRIVLAILLSFLSITNSELLAQGPSPVRTEPVQREEVQEFYRVIGSLKAISRGDVAALEDGRVLEVTVREGAAVKEKDVLARIDDRRLQAQFRETEASRTMVESMIIQRKAELKRAEQDLERAKRLYDRNVSTEQNLQHAEAELDITKSQLKAAEQQLNQIDRQLELLQVRLDDTTIKAPYNGRVVARHTEPGEWIRPGDPIVTLVSTGAIEAWLEVPERYSNALEMASEPIVVEITASGERLKATDSKRIPQVDPRSRLMSMVLDLPNKEDRLSPGMSICAWLPVRSKTNELVVSKDAVLQTLQESYVYQAVKDIESKQHKAQKVPVRILFEMSDHLVIDSPDLSEGDLVIVEGNERLMPETIVAITPREPTKIAKVKSE
ncbi:Efflux RND transporter periplasmic adaptor subunit [Planctomycetales bacterium 10988]|nr:Efflux RND transporter periplasmic adaptor subunit [Planctomycetales bacterium 10988]